MSTFVKTRSDAPAEFFGWEAAGLGWLHDAEAAGGVGVVRVREVGLRHITLDRIEQAPATKQAAESFGRALAATHVSGAAAFGVGPPGWPGVGFIGRQPLALQSFSRWGEFYAQARLMPYAQAANRCGNLDDAGFRRIEAVCDRLIAGDYDDDRPPARIHGDLWGGNVLYSATASVSTASVSTASVSTASVSTASVSTASVSTASVSTASVSTASIGAASIEAVLIDPAAHGGHGLTDLAMLALFGTEHLERVLVSYTETAGSAAGWRDLIGLHQLHPLLVHAVTHGPSYGRAAQKIAAEYA